jgi:hypothetical protein
MRFLLGVLVGYSMRGKRKLLIIVLATVAFIVYIILPAIALMALRLDVKKERQSRPAQTRVPSLKGMSYKNAETKLHNANLNIRLLATRGDLPPGGVSNIWIQPLDDNSPKQLTDFKSDRIFSFDWSRDGKWLALARGPEQRDVVLISDLR